MSEQTEEEYLIERLSKLLAEISVIVNGPQPMGVLWSYADLPQKVQALKDAAALNAQGQLVEALRSCIKALGEFATDESPEGWVAIDAIQDAEAALAAASASSLLHTWSTPQKENKEDNSNE